MYSLICPNQGTAPHLSQAGFSHQDIYEQKISFAQLPSEYTGTTGVAVMVRLPCIDKRGKNKQTFFPKKGRLYMKETFQLLGVSSVVPSSPLKGPVFSKQPPAG